MLGLLLLIAFLARIAFFLLVKHITWSKNVALLAFFRDCDSRLFYVTWCDDGDGCCCCWMDFVSDRISCENDKLQNQYALYCFSLSDWFKNLFLMSSFVWFIPCNPRLIFSAACGKDDSSSCCAAGDIALLFSTFTWEINLLTALTMLGFRYTINHKHVGWQMIVLLMITTTYNISILL